MPHLDPTPGSRRARRPAPLLLLPLLLGACASAPPSPPPEEASGAAVQAAAETAASVAGPAAEASADQARLDKAVAGFGGAERIDGLRTLVVESTMTRTPEGGRETTIHQRSYVAFPDRFRREAILEGGMTVASAVGPAGAFVVSPLGILPLPEEERAAMVHGFARAPLSLLRNRSSEAFSATAAGEGELDGQPVEYLEIVYDGDHHHLALDPKTGQVQEIRFTTRPATAPDTEATADTADGAETAGGAEIAGEAETGGEAETEATTDDEATAESEGAEGDASEAGEVVIRYADHREVDGLVYPFRSTTTSEGQPTITRVVHSLQVDTELDPALFEPPPTPPEGLLPPTAPQVPAAPSAPDEDAPEGQP